MYKDLSGGHKESYKQKPARSNMKYQNSCHFTDCLWGLLGPSIMHLNKMIQESGWNIGKDNDGFMGGDDYHMTVSSAIVDQNPYILFYSDMSL